METYFYNSHKYDDIMGLPHHVSASRPHMPRGDRAAQFSPFSALSGFGAAIRETGRQTDPRIGLSEDDRAVLDANLQMIQEKLADLIETYKPIAPDFYEAALAVEYSRLCAGRWTRRQ